MEGIRTGDLESVKLCMQEKEYGEYGTLSRAPLRSFKNPAIVAIATFGRAAIAGAIFVT